MRHAALSRFRKSVTRSFDENPRQNDILSRRSAGFPTQACSVLLLAAVLAVAGPPARAQDATLSGTLKAIRDRGAVLVGVRQGAVPFAFRNRAGQPVGFSVDICDGIAADAAAALSQPLLEPDAPEGQAGLRVSYVPVKSDARIPMVTGGQVDLECGSTTATAERAAQVAFSPVFFLAGTRLLVPRASAAASYRDVRSVAVGAGTTNAAVMKRLAEGAAPPLDVMEAPGVPEALDLLRAGKVEAVASDDVLLAGLVASQADGADYRMVGDFLSFEPYAIAFRRDDPQFAALVQSSFARMARDGVLTARYRRWFTDKLPDGQDLGLPMSAQLTEMYRALGQTD